jgi:hypothetical protein
MGKWMGLVAVSAAVLAAAVIMGLRPVPGEASPEGDFPVEVALPASHGRLVGTGVAANSLMLVFEDEEGTIRIFDYLKREGELSAAIRIDRR